MSMRDFARTLLLEDEVAEFWLPTFPGFAVAVLRDFVDAAVRAAEAESRRGVQQQQQQQQHATTTTTTAPGRGVPGMFLAAQRRDRESNSAVDGANGAKPPNSAHSSSTVSTASGKSMLLPAGMRSAAQFAALLEMQVQQQKQRDAERKAKEEAEEVRLARQRLGLTEDEYGAGGGNSGSADDPEAARRRQDQFKRQAAALQERRKREVLERLRTATETQARTQEVARHQHMAALARARGETGGGGGGSGSAAAGGSGDAAMTSSSSAAVVVDAYLLQQATSFFAAFPPAFATLPPLTAPASSDSSLVALCRTTTVGTDDVFVCF
jgi:hypothetical protein